MPSAPTLISIALGLAAFWGLFALLRGFRHVATARAKIANLVETHLETLARRRLTLVKTDPYGLVDEGPWRKEYRYFIDKLVMPHLSASERGAIAFRREALFDELIANSCVAARPRARGFARDGEGFVACGIRALVLHGAPRGGLESARHRHFRRSRRRCHRGEGRRHHRVAMQAAPFGGRATRRFGKTFSARKRYRRRGRGGRLQRGLHALGGSLIENDGRALVPLQRSLAPRRSPRFRFGGGLSRLEPATTELRKGFWQKPQD